jgi:hypothetical protein
MPPRRSLPPVRHPDSPFPAPVVPVRSGGSDGSAGSRPPATPGRRSRGLATLVLPLLVLPLLVLAGCGGEDGADGAEEVLPRNGIQGAPDDHLAGVRLLRLPPAGPEYPNARLGLVSPEPGARIAEGDPVELRFTLSGFELDVPTPDAGGRGLARAHGQHVHLVVNDGAYRALYDLSEPVVLEDLPAGTHAIRAFPGRDWHEGVKTPGALVQRIIVVGEGEATLPPPEEWGPTLIYSRPQGEYVGVDADSVLVDFYLSGVRLSEDGPRVRLVVDGSREFLIHEWAPHVLLGLPPGERTLRMELVGADGARIRSPFTPVERTITIRKDDG